MRNKDDIVCAAIAKFLRIYISTCRIETYGTETEKELLSRRKDVLYAGWHRGLVFVAYNFMDRGAALMVSPSKDGELLAGVMRHLNYYNPRGSSTRGGKNALASMVDYIREGNVGGLSPDGPTGPPYVCKPGIIQLAARTGSPLLPYACDADPAYEFNSWDRTFLPLPFCRVVSVYGEPVYVPEGLSRDEYENIRTDFDRKLNTLSYQTRYCVKNRLRGVDPRTVPVPEDYMDYLPRKERESSRIKAEAL